MLIFLTISIAFAHSGRTNSEGCHNDNINGGYHCHNGVSVPSNSGNAYIPRVVDLDESYKYHVDGEIVRWPILSCISTKTLRKVGETFICNDIQFKLRYITDYDYDLPPIFGGKELSHYLNSCYQTSSTADGLKDPIICNRSILSVGFTEEGRRKFNENKKEESLNSDIKSLSADLQIKKDLLTEKIVDLEEKIKKYKESLELFEKQSIEFEVNKKTLATNIDELKKEKIKFEEEKERQKQSLERSKKILYREEANDICGSIALKIYKKFEKNPKKYSNNLDSFSKSEGFDKKCESLDYSSLILPVLSNQKCGKFALQIQASYNSNKKYYGDLGGAAQHYSFNLYCPGIQYLDFIEEINDSSAKK